MSSKWNNLLVVVLVTGFMYVLPLSSVAATAASTVSTTAQSGQTSDWSYVRDAKNTLFASEISRDVNYDESDLVSIYHLNKGTLLADYKVNHGAREIDTAIWGLFSNIADPKITKDQLLYFATYKDAQDPTLGFTARLGTGKKTWVLAVNANNTTPSSQKWRRDVSVILLHEYGHLVTLNNNQLDPKRRSTSNCHKEGEHLVPQEGCAKQKSYLSAYEEQFWSPAEIAEAATASSKGTTLDFYNSRKSEFVTVYAATSPTEDIAESFTNFILTAKPTGTLEKDQKVLFFYNYPELVTMREGIRARIGADFK